MNEIIINKVIERLNKLQEQVAYCLKTVYIEIEELVLLLPIADQRTWLEKTKKRIKELEENGESQKTDSLTQKDIQKTFFKNEKECDRPDKPSGI